MDSPNAGEALHMPPIAASHLGKGIGAPDRQKPFDYLESESSSRVGKGSQVVLKPLPIRAARSHFQKFFRSRRFNKAETWGSEPPMNGTILYAHWALAPYCIDAKLRALRVNKHLTLARLAEETGLSTALLSKLETGRMIPTLPTLVTISRVYGVGLDHFFSGADRHSLSITRKEHLHGSTRSAGPARVALNAVSELPRMVVETLDLSAGTAWGPEDGAHETCFFAYVLDGAVEMNCGGMGESLAAGDCAYIESQLPVSCVAHPPHCRVLVVRPAGEVKPHL